MREIMGKLLKGFLERTSKIFKKGISVEFTLSNSQIILKISFVRISRKKKEKFLSKIPEGSTKESEETLAIPRRKFKGLPGGSPEVFPEEALARN